MELLKVNYNGKIYSSNSYPFSVDVLKLPIRDVSKIPQKILNLCKFSESEDSFVIDLGYIDFDLDDEGNPLFNERFTKKVSFDKNTLKGSGDKIDSDDFIKGDVNFYSEFFKFFESIISLNKNISEHLSITPKYLKIKIDTGMEYRTTMTNFYNLLVFNYLEYEKIITSDSCSILEANLSSKSFSMEEATKLSASLGIPKFALPIIKDLDLEGSISEIRKISKKIDGNSLRIIFTFIDKLSIIFKHNVAVKDRPSVMKKFLSDISDCLEKGYKITDLLNYLLRQNLYYTEEPPFCFPYKEAMFLADYIKMADKYGVKIDKYPSQLKRQHDILSKNVLALSVDSPELEERFKNSVDKYKNVEKIISIKDVDDDGNEIIKEFVFSVPRRIKDIVEEGTDLHHCVGSYSDRIINGLSRVVFLREKETPNKSFITIDIDEDYKLIEAKKAFNEDVDGIAKKALDKWLKEIKK